MAPTHWKRSSTCSTPIANTNWRASFPDETHLTLYRGVNRVDDHETLATLDNKHRVVLFNSLSSFTANRERADEFGDYLLTAQVPLSKVFCYTRLLPGMLQGEDEYTVIGGLYEVSCGVLNKPFALIYCERGCYMKKPKLTTAFETHAIPSEMLAKAFPGGFNLRDEANALTAYAFRNGTLEDLHAGKDSPLLNDPKLSRISDSEMKSLMIETSEKLASMLLLREKNPEQYKEFIQCYSIMYCGNWER